MVPSGQPRIEGRDVTGGASAPSGAERLHYLDGLRGWAALAVVIFHCTWELFKAYVPQLKSSYPGFVNDGKLAVYVFFVLSGFVLSYPYLRSGEIGFLQKTALRRYARLTIPIAAASLLAFVLLKLGLFVNLQASRIVGKTGWLDGLYLQSPSIFGWLKFSVYDVYFRYDPAASLDIVLWTMAFELGGSFLVFGMLALAGARLQSRLLWYIAMALICFREQHILLGFVFGAALAEFALSARARALAASRGGNIVGALLLIVAFAASVVLRDIYSPRLCAGIALLVVAGAVVSGNIRQFLENPVSRFLGRVSFPLYLVHIPVICSLTSFSIVALAGLHWNPIAIVCATVPETIVVSLLAAWLFSPVERFAIRSSHRFSRLIIGA